MDKHNELLHTGIAVIGLACQFPGSNNADQFWINLIEGRESISFFSDQELKEAGISEVSLKNPHYIKAKGVIEDVFSFDRELFGYSQKEAENIDPQQRLLLECAWEALENAGYDAEHYEGSIGVFVGCNPSSYFLSHIYPNHLKDSTDLDELSLLLANGPDYLATRISYKLNLTGPSKTIQTACSTSLVTVHDACQNLLSYQCDMALAGGVAISFPNKNGYIYTPDSISSPDGHCRAFDKQAAGTVFGDGLGLVVLKRLDDAIADQDKILAVIKGSAVNNDGSNKVGYLAPSVQGQAEVIAAALAAADVSAETITYVETHGTGTLLGDPIEISALTQAYQLHTQQKQFCAIGSLKTNFGHLTTAAGVAGLIKTILMIKHKKIPPSLHFESPNEQIDFQKTPFYVNKQLNPWNSNYSPLRAGVSSFGIGGTNSHLILEEPPLLHSEPIINTEDVILPFSAKNKLALQRLVYKYIEYLKNDPANLSDIAYTLQVGRTALPFRIAIVSSTIPNLIDQLERIKNGHLPIKTLPNHQEQNIEVLFRRLQNEKDNRRSLLQALSVLWEEGKLIPWKQLYHTHPNKRVPLPTYSFTKTQCCKDINSFQSSKNVSSAQSSMSLTESIIACIWQNLLLVSEVKKDDNFFELGGDSLTAIDMLNRLRLLFNVEISLGLFMANTSNKELAHILDKAVDGRNLTTTTIDIHS